LFGNLRRLKARHKMPEIRVFPTPGFETIKWSTNPEEIKQRIGAFGLAVGEYAAHLLSRSRIATGVSWGDTLAMTVVGMKSAAISLNPNRMPIMYFPVSGEPLGVSVTSSSASTLAAKLDEVLNGNRKRCLSLAAVPALIPKAFVETETEIGRQN